RAGPGLVRVPAVDGAQARRPGLVRHHGGRGGDHAAALSPASDAKGRAAFAARLLFPRVATWHVPRGAARGARGAAHRPRRVRWRGREAAPLPEGEGPMVDAATGGSDPTG